MSIIEPLRTIEELHLRRERNSRDQFPPDGKGDFRPRPEVAARCARSEPALANVAFTVCAGLSDICVVVASAAGAELLSRVLQADRPVTDPMLLIGCVVATLFVVPGATHGEYVVSAYFKPQGRATRAAIFWNLSFFCVLAIGFVTKTSDLVSRSALLVFYCGGFVAVLATRALLVKVTRTQIRTGGVLCQRVFLVGYKNKINDFRARYETAMLGINIVGSAAVRGNGRLREDLVLAAARARLLSPDQVVILAPWSQRTTIDACIEAFMRVPASIHLGPEPILARLSPAHFSSVGPAPTFSLWRRPLSNTDIFLKRSMDFVGAALGLVLLSPLFAVTALLIKLDSPGPVIFSQRRCGFNQETFRIFKFRSMRTMEDGSEVVQACRHDARVTRVGRWLRRFNIDELPQLVNVLRGEMSLVGPRPHALAHDEIFGRSIAAYARRHNIRPGITGWAQVNGYRGEITSEKDIRQRVEHDLFYLDNWSLWLDLQCLWRTVASPHGWRNAY